MNEDKMEGRLEEVTDEITEQDRRADALVERCHAQVARQKEEAQ